MKGCCVFCNNREALQCVYYNDVEGFKRCLKSHTELSNPFQPYALDCKVDALSAAVKTNNLDILKAILQYEDETNKKGINRVKLPSVNLEKVGTGQANRYQFFFPIRKV